MLCFHHSHLWPLPNAIPIPTLLSLACFAYTTAICDPFPTPFLFPLSFLWHALNTPQPYISVHNALPIITSISFACFARSAAREACICSPRLPVAVRWAVAACEQKSCLDANKNLTRHTHKVVNKVASQRLFELTQILDETHTRWWTRWRTKGCLNVHKDLMRHTHTRWWTRWRTKGCLNVHKDLIRHTHTHTKGGEQGGEPKVVWMNTRTRWNTHTQGGEQGGERKVVWMYTRTWWDTHTRWRTRWQTKGCLNVHKDLMRHTHTRWRTRWQTEGCLNVHKDLMRHTHTHKVANKVVNKTIVSCRRKTCRGIHKVANKKQDGQVAILKEITKLQMIM